MATVLRPSRFLKAKRRVASLLTREVIGRAILRVGDGWVRSGSCRVAVPSSMPGGSIIAAQIFWGLYERSELRLLRKMRLPGDVIELGSSLGCVSAHASRRMRDGSRLVCVEPNPDLRLSLESTLTRNCGRRPVTVVGDAIDYSVPEGEATILLKGATSSTSRLGPAASGSMDSEATPDPAVRVKTVRLDTLVKEVRKPYSLITDIEGAEAGLFLTERLDGCLEILAELHESSHRGRYYSPAVLCELITQRDYEKIAVDGNVVLFRAK